MQRLDIRLYKNNLRENCKQYRRDLNPVLKARMDTAIRQKLQSMRQYKRASTIIVYVSKSIEIDTHQIILDALAQRKQVAVPRCIDGTRLMEFYYIHSFDDLEKGTFGVLEPIVSRCKKVEDLSGRTDSICLVPALAYDYAGFRLGYGGGYYDRFLSGYQGIKIGMIYSGGLRTKLPHGRYDVPVNIVVTERFIRTIQSPRFRHFG